MHFGSQGRHGNRSNFALRILAALLLLLIGFAGTASLQPGEAREPGARRAIAPLLKSPKPLRIGVVGDSVAGDLARGLHKLVAAGHRHKVVKFTKPATGLMRDDVYDWAGALRGFLGKTKLDVIAIIIGGNDRQSIWKNGGRLDHGTPEWRAEYARRIARFMDVLAKSGAKVYWVGLPVVRSGAMSRDYRRINAIQREQALRHGFTYVSLWEAFADAEGNYTSFGPSIDGVKRRLRKNDGMHFSLDGELLLAHVVARAIARDMDEIGSVR
jgi:hypothetical protein